MIGAFFAAAILIGYLIGSLPFGVMVSRGITGTDIRQLGSGKIGSTNVLRTAGRKAALLVLLLDMGKGVLAVIVAGLIANSGHLAWYSASLIWTTRVAQVLAALAAIAGHSWSVFLKFKGGRGVATFLGGLLALYWPAAVVGGLFMLLIGFRTRYMSLGSIIGAVVAFVMLMSLNVLELDFFLPSPPIDCVIYAMICAIFIYVMHRDNIIRLISGTERKLGDKVEVNNSHTAK